MTNPYLERDTKTIFMSILNKNSPSAPLESNEQILIREPHIKIIHVIGVVKVARMSDVSFIDGIIT